MLNSGDVAQLSAGPLTATSTGKHRLAKYQLEHMIRPVLSTRTQGVFSEELGAELKVDAESVRHALKRLETRGEAHSINEGGRRLRWFPGPPLSSQKASTQKAEVPAAAESTPAVASSAVTTTVKEKRLKLPEPTFAIDDLGELKIMQGRDVLLFDVAATRRLFAFMCSTAKLWQAGANTQVLPWPP